MDFKSKAAIAEALAAAQAQLAEMVRELEAGRFRPVPFV